MAMQYDVFLWTEGDQVLAEFPDCPGCQTFAEMKPEAIAEASYEALNGWLEAHLIDGQVPPRPMPRTSAPPGKALAHVPVSPQLLAALAIRWARHDAGLSQKELGARAGISQQQVAKLENPDENPTVGTLQKVARALGLTVSVGFEPAVPVDMVQSAVEASHATSTKRQHARPRRVVRSS